MNYFATIILSNSAIGDDQKGITLANFLRFFTTNDAICVIEPDNLATHSPIKTEYLFICLPSPVSLDALDTIQWKHCALCVFDDSVEATCLDDLERFSSVAQTLLKPAIDRGLEYPVQHIGCLPIRFRSFYNMAPTWLCRRRYDCSFLGDATYFDGYHQRIDWVNELKQQKKINFYGGLINPSYKKPLLKIPNLKLDDATIKRISVNGVKQRFWYLRSLAKSKIALCPTGFARWTYRHYEGMLTRSIILSTQLPSTYTLLIPFPKLDNFYCINDKEPVVPAIEAILSNLRHWESIAEENYAHMNQYLENGVYSTKKPKVFESFLAQIH